MQHEVKLYRICWGIFCSCVNGLYCSLRLLAVPATWLIVRRWCITRFSLCLSVDCESHLTGLALSSPARMRRAQQDASTASLWACVWDREREDGVQREWKCDLSPSFLFLSDMHFISRLHEKVGARGIRGQSCYFETVRPAVWSSWISDFKVVLCMCMCMLSILCMIQRCLDRKSNKELFHLSQCSCL